LDDDDEDEEVSMAALLLLLVLLFVLLLLVVDVDVEDVVDRLFSCKIISSCSARSSAVKCVNKFLRDNNTAGR